MFLRLIGRLGPVAIALAVAGMGAYSHTALAQSWPPGPGAPQQPGQPTYQNQLCLRLEAQLQAIDRGGDAGRSEQIRRYEDTANRQQSEVDRMVAQARRNGCEGSGFFLFGGGQSQSQQCVDLNNQISRMRGNLDRLNGELQRLRGSGGDGGEQRRSVMVALAQNNCGPQYRTAMRQQPGFFDQLFGREEASEPSSDLANPETQAGGFRTICVRTCDGFYFPISYATSPARFRDDEKTCQRLCPNAEVILFSHRNPGEEVANATSLNGQVYSSLPNAFRYRQEFNAACSCKRPGQSWMEAVGPDTQVERGDIVVTEDRAKAMSVQTPPRPQQTKGARQPPAAEPAQATSPTAAAPAAQPADADPSKRTIRSVGPTFVAPPTPKN